MALQIRVIPDALRQSAEHIEQLINENKQLYTRIKVITSKLDEAWDGSASEFMIVQLNELIKYPNQAEEEFIKGREALQSIAQAFESIDEGEVTAPKFTFHIIDMPIAGPGGIWKPFPPLSSGRIRVIPDGLREAAHESQSVIDMSNEISQRIDKILAELQNSWEGRSYNSFSESFVKVKEIYIQLSEALEKFSHMAMTAADRYEEIDNLLS